MLVSLAKEKLNTLGNEDLCWVCIEPTILTYKQTKGTDFTQKYYQKLTKAQQALFMYTVFSRHALNSPEEYYWWTAYLLIHRNAWPETKKALLFFQEEPTMEHLDEIISLLKTKEINYENAPLSLLKSDQTLNTFVNASYRKFQKLSQHTIHTISSYIRNHPNDFIQLDC